MRLSVENINRNSPYWVIQLDDMTFRFATKNGVVYRVGFNLDHYFLKEGAYHFFIANDSGTFAPKDSDVFKVISLVIEEFFRQPESVMLYICEASDHREAIRAKLYQRWFDNYPHEGFLTLRTAEMNFDGYIVYSGMIIRNNHPIYQRLLKAFDSFTNQAPSRYRIRPK